MYIWLWQKIFPVHPIFGLSCCWTIFWMILNSWLCQWALADSPSDVLLLHKWGNYIWHATLMHHPTPTSTILFSPIFSKFTKFPDSFQWFYLLSFQQGAWKINMTAKFSLKAGRVWSPQASLGRSIMSPMKGGGGVSPHELWHVTRRLLKRRNWGGGSIYGGYDPCGVP